MGWSAREFGDTKSHRGRGVLRYKSILKFDQGGDWVVEESCDVTSLGGYLTLPSHQEPSTEWCYTEAPIGRGADRKRAR